MIDDINEIKDYITECFEADDRVASVYAKDGYYVWNVKDVQYPSIAFNLTGVTVNEDSRVYTYQFYGANLQAEDIDSTTDDNYQLLYEILEGVFQGMENGLSQADNNIVGISRPRTYTFAPLKLADVCALVSVEVSFTVTAEC